MPSEITGSRKEFCDGIYYYLVQYGPSYGISPKVYDAIIAQCTYECAWGTSYQAVNIYNYWGMTAGSSWTGDTYITSDGRVFRKYHSMGEGVEGFFVFTNTDRYANLKGETDPYTFIYKISTDGWNSESTYIAAVTQRYNNYNFHELYGQGEQPDPPGPGPGPGPETNIPIWLLMKISTHH